MIELGNKSNKKNFLNSHTTQEFSNVTQTILGEIHPDRGTQTYILTTNINKCAS